MDNELYTIRQVMVVQPTYPLTAGLSQTQLRAAITLALENLDDIHFPPEWIDRDLMREKGWPSFKEALLAAHNPQGEVSFSACTLYFRTHARALPSKRSSP